MNQAATLEQLYTPVATPLGEVRTAIDALWRDTLALIGVEADQAPPTAGKLLRPALCLLTAGAAGAEDPRRFVQLATSLEALHIASLTHDDVVDHAMVRRGLPSLNAQWDNHAAVLGGDFLVARGVEMLATYESGQLVLDVVAVLRRMAEGELRFFGRREAPISREDCIMLAEYKTASLFAEACRAPAALVSPDLAPAMARFGKSLGVAFQIVDDVLDLSQPATTLGKPACGDVAEGKKTLPILFLREGLDAAERDRLGAMSGTTLTDADRTWIGAMGERTGALEQSLAAAREYADQARAALQTLAPSSYRDSLSGLVDFVLERNA